MDENNPRARRRWSRRAMLAGAGGAAAGALTVGAGWWAAGDDAATSTAMLPTADRLGHALLWTTLGTMSGPTGSSARAQPANLLHDGEHAIVVDAGDGMVDQLVKADVALTSVQTVVLSHLHIDHTAGLLGLVGRRLQQFISTPLMVFGPPGTAQEIERIQGSLQGLVELMSTGGRRLPPPSFGITVQEITDGATVTLGPVRLTAATNSHYGFAPGTPEATRFQSLSYRFDMPDRAIVFTGDTGPCPNVERLARGADLLVSEIDDPDAALEQVEATRPDLPAAAIPALREHFDSQHLSATNVGLLARAAGVGAVVLTHNPLDDARIAAARPQIAANFAGPVAVANDLDNW
ncbi:MBL fold metallo-hydrolase [Pseudonocardia alni]|uniref:MBL fold metallo-hydrolase n=1 Tax=Pseudonocardia alni TaxID=33907 RepID=UPI00280AD8B8|nr:MBL fold metallo-hydrolase [Pseudonocardia alni]